MASQAIIFLIFGIAFLISAGISFISFRYARNADKKIDELLEKGKIKDFKDIFLSQKKKAEELEEGLKEAFLKIEALEKTMQTTIQKMAIVRFNPFNDMGGNQSFAIALLDEKNSGFVISSLFAKDGGRVYAKAIKNGKSEFTLLDEEIKAIEKAINSK